MILHRDEGGEVMCYSIICAIQVSIWITLNRNELTLHGMN